MSTLGTILKDNWEWRSQIVHLARFELKKQRRGAVLGWVWIIARPIIYVFCFWFAIDVGLRGGRAAPAEDVPYILWLSAGIVPWFFMSKMLGGGIDVLKKYSYLVNKVKFPLCAISSVYELAEFFIQLILQVMLIVMYFVCGQPLDVHLLQLPVLLLVMYAFWYFFSVLMSPLCALSRDVKNFMSALSTPFFWLSGVIFNVRDIPIEWIQTVMYFNPITTFVTAFREVVYSRNWLWDDPMLCLGFAAVFVVTAVLALVVYKRTYKVVPDVF